MDNSIISIPRLKILWQFCRVLTAKGIINLILANGYQSQHPVDATGWHWIIGDFAGSGGVGTSGRISYTGGIVYLFMGLTPPCITAMVAFVCVAGK